MKLNVFGSAVVVVVLAIAAISFIWIPAMGGVGAVKTFASWDGREITNEPDSSFFENLQYVQRLFETFGGNLPQDPAMQKYFQHQITDTAMTTSIIDLAMETEVEKCGYAPTDKLINLNLIRQFTDPSTGLYSQELYQNTPEANKLKMRANIVSNLRKARYIQDLFGYNGEYGLKTSSKEAEFITALNTEKRSINYASFSSTKFPNEKIKEYAEEHSELFVKYDFSLVSFQDEKAATTVSAEITKGTVDFEDAFKNQDTNAVNPYVDADGKLLNAYRKDLNTLFPNAEDLAMVVGLKVGETSKPVKMNALYVVLKCNAEPTQPDFNDQAMLNEVSYYMRQYEKGIIEDYLVAHAEEFTKLAKEKTMNDACAEFDITAVTTASFPINYGNSQFLQPLVDNDPILASATTNEDFFKAVFTLKEGEYSKPFLLNENAVVFNIADIEPVDEEPAESTMENYKSENQSWSDYYPLTLLVGRYPIPLAQSTVIDFIITSPKAKNDLYKFTE